MPNRTTLTASAFAGLLFAGTTAIAAPLPAPIPAAADRAEIVQVGFGCPYGLVPDGYGGCRPPLRRLYGGYGGYGYGGGYGYYRPRPVYRPYGFYRPYPY